VWLTDPRKVYRFKVVESLMRLLLNKTFYLLIACFLELSIKKV